MAGLAARVGVVATAILILSASGASAGPDTFPLGPVKIVTQQGPGGATIR